MRLGRPPSEEPKNKTIKTRMTGEDVEKLDAICALSGKTRSEVLRLSLYRFYSDMVSGVKAEKHQARSQLPAAVKRREK